MCPDVSEFETVRTVKSEHMLKMAKKKKRKKIGTLIKDVPFRSIKE